MSEPSSPDLLLERPEMVVSLGELWERWDLASARAPAETSGDAPSNAAPTAATRRRRWWRLGSTKDAAETARQARTELLGPEAAAWVASLAERGPSPVGWAVLPACLDELLGQALPPRHDVTSLLRVADSAAGEERCARAYDRVMHEPMSAELLRELERAVEAANEPIRLIPSLVAAGVQDERLRDLMPPLGPAADAAALGEALRLAWASMVLPSVVTVAAHLGAHEMSMAVLLLPASVASRVEPAVARAAAADERHDGSPRDAGPPAEPDRTDFVRLAPGRSASDEMSSLSRSLLLPVLGAAGADLGRRLGLPLSAVATVVQGRDHALGLDVAALRQCLGRLPESLARLVLAAVGATAPFADDGASSGGTSSVAVRSAASAAGGLGAPASEQTLEQAASSPRREAAPASDDVGPPASLRSGHVASAARASPVAHRASLLQRLRRARTAVAAAELVSEAVAIMPSLAPAQILTIEASLEQRLSALEQIDLGLLPTDALGTSVEHARGLLDDVLRLWLRQKGAELALQAFVAARVRARLPRSSALIGVWLTELGRGCLACELAEEIETAAGHVLGHEATARALASGVSAIEQLPAGPARGCLQQIIAAFGDWAARPWELAVPRWNEDPRELFDLVRVVAERGRREGGTATAPASLRANALAAGRDELVRLEPTLGSVDRALVRVALRRSEALRNGRRAIDRALLRALAQCRRVALAMDRRLRRFDARVQSSAAFSATVDELRAALETESRDLGRLLRVRQAERDWAVRRAAARSTDARGEPAHGSAGTPGERRLGASASPGSCIGRVRVAEQERAPTLEAGEVLVAFHVPATWGAIVQRAAAVISETDGCLSGAAEAARSAAVPMVGGIENVARWLRTGEAVRVDGARGLVERLG